MDVSETSLLLCLKADSSPTPERATPNDESSGNHDGGSTQPELGLGCSFQAGQGHQLSIQRESSSSKKLTAQLDFMRQRGKHIGNIFPGLDAW